VPQLNDNEDFNMLRKAFASLKFTQENQDDIFKIVAGILHLGNVTFTKSSDNTSIADHKVLSVASGLIGCDSEELAKCMCNKRITVGKDVTISPVGDEKACQSRDSIAKLIYSRLFKWLVAGCNTALGAEMSTKSRPAASTLAFIGVLDIAGFESFETNSLEQLFINLSNEKL